MPGLIAVPAVWRKLLGEDFDAAVALCFQPANSLAQLYPCPRHCGCAHEIVRTPSDSAHPPSPGGEGRGEGEPSPIKNQNQETQNFTAICRCDPPRCYDLTLALQDVTPLEANRAKLGRALCRAFGCDSRPAKLDIPNTFQFGSWSTEAVPMLLTIQTDRHVFRRAVAEAIAGLKRRFMLFTPTSAHFDASAQSRIASADAALFSLDATLQLCDNGTLHSVKTPGELFAQFTPQPKETDQTVWQRALAIVRQLDSEGPSNPPSVLRVFHLYFVEELSVDEIANRCECSKGTVSNRLALIRVKTGMNLEQLRGMGDRR